MYNVIIIGAGGFGREVYNWAQESLPQNEFKINGFLDIDKNALDNYDIDINILGTEDTYNIQEHDRFIIAVGNIELKKKIVEKIKSRNGEFMTLVHKTALVACTAKIGEGVVICPFAYVSDNVILDNFVMLNFYASCGHDAKIGEYSILSPYATVNGFVVLEEEVFLATHSTVIAYKKVGAKSKVSANSAVMHNVPPNSLVFGVPGSEKTIK
ncbi:acetyltransferase [bacterium]